MSIAKTFIGPIELLGALHEFRCRPLCPSHLYRHRRSANDYYPLPRKLMNDIGNVVCAIIERHGEFLIAQRPRGHHLENLWEFPGGKVRSQESSTDAIVREIWEELGVIIQVMSSLTPSCHSYEDFSLTLLPYRCSIVEGEPEAKEHQQLAWVTIDSVKNFNFSEADIPILKEYLQFRRAI